MNLPPSGAATRGRERAQFSFRHFRHLCRGVLFGAGLLASALWSTATAATYTVTSAEDSGAGTLREALALAAGNDDSYDGMDTINFDLPLPSGIVVETALHISTIYGLTINGPALDAAGEPQISVVGNLFDRVLLIRPGDTETSAPSDVHINNLMITGGHAGGGEVFGPGLGGGIYAYFVNLRLNGCVIDENGANGHGGGICVEYARLEMTRCTVKRNTASLSAGKGGGIAFRSGGYFIEDEGYATSIIRESTIAENEAQNGGGIAFDMAGWGYWIEGSLLSGNTAAVRGGGIYNIDSEATFVSSTISGNYAIRDGAASVRTSGEGEAKLTFTFCTITENTARFDTGGVHVRGSYYSPAMVHLTMSILAGNRLELPEAPVVEADLFQSEDGEVCSGDYNLIRVPVPAPPPPTLPSWAAAHDRIGTTFDPYLEPLADNGGPTRTHALRLNQGASAASNYVPAEAYSDAEFPWDQRGPGFPRRTAHQPTEGSQADIGAFENQAGQILREQDGYAPDDFTTIAECSGDPAMVTISFRVIDLDGDMAFIALRDGGPGGDEIWQAPVEDEDIPPGLGGRLYTATFPVPHSALTTPYHFSIMVSDATQAAYTTAAETWVTLTDTTPPLLIVKPSPVTLIADAESCSATPTFADLVASVSDLCDPAPVVLFSVLGSDNDPSTTPPTLPLGLRTVIVTARDDEDNETSAEVQVLVAPDVSGVPASVTVALNPATGGAQVNLAEIVDLGTYGDCGLIFDVSVRFANNEVYEPAAFGDVPFPSGTSQVIVSIYSPLPDEGLQLLTTSSFDVVVEENNVAWPLAFSLPLTPTAPGSTIALGGYSQYLTQAGESRWFKFQGLPGSRINVTLSNLPANYDLVVYSDIAQAYAALLALVNSPEEADQLLALLGAEFAPEAYSPEAYSPEAYSPEAYSPEAYSPEAYSPEAYSPEAYSPEAYSPEAYSPEAYSPEAYSPEAYSPEAYSPEAYSPEAYAGAQLRSLIAFSATAGSSSESVRFNTYSRSGTFYVRVRGQNGVFSDAAPFTVSVEVQQDLCNGVTDLNITPATSAIAGSPTSLILWDSARIAGTAVEKTALTTSLASFAASANAVVIDLAGNARITALNAQADANPACPFAKNLVAEAIRNLIIAARGPSGAPSIADVTLIGNDRVIPFFRSNDEALLASEANYFPPVFDDTHSQSSLRLAQVLSQDRYGSFCQVTLSTGPYDLPDIAVGRLVETATEVTAYLNAYAGLFNGSVSTGGVLPVPQSLFISGYDFLSDSAAAVQTEFTAGLGASPTVHTLIPPAGAAPAESWTAAQFKTLFLGSRHDLSYLAGHFSTSGALAADYTTRVTAAEVAASTTNFEFAFLMSTGCHSGYSTVDNEAVPEVTETPDWAQAFARKRALWVAGTGYQYGDTDFLEYSERLYTEVARALRTGTGPISVGQAVIAAKNRYLQETSLMRGIHEKTLVEMALYGLPMVKLNLPGTRLPVPTSTSVVTSVTPVPSGPGTSFGLVTGSLPITPTLTPQTKTLDIVGTESSTIVASYLTGGQGIVTLPGEPVRALESRTISHPAGLVRGVGFRSGAYTDVGGFLPLTGAPATEIRGVHGDFFSEVFFPARPWNVNQLGLLCGSELGTELNIFPAQFKSTTPGVAAGTSRQFSSMLFSVFYCANMTEAALASPPAINIVATSIVGADIAFTVEVGGIVDVGVQETWITYTSTTGSFPRTWQSLILTPPTDPLVRGVGTWTGLLVGGASQAANLRFMVQAVNGVGGVALNTNFGRFFTIGTSTLDETGADQSELVLQPPVPATGAYRQIVPVSAKLTDAANTPLAGRLVAFRAGALAAFGTTNASGLASASLTLATTPGAYTLEASFAGDATFTSSSDDAPLQINKQATALTFTVPATPLGVGDAVVTLLAADSTPLKEKTLVILVTTGATTTAVAEITDGAGQARISHPVPAGTNYTLTAYFGQNVALPGGGTVPLTDPLYGPSQATTTFALGSTNALTLAHEKVIVLYGDKKAPGATNFNRGHSQTDIAASLNFTDPAVDPNTIPASPTTTQLTARVRATLSGKTLFDGPVLLSTLPLANRKWAGTATIAGSKTTLYIQWLPPEFKSTLSDPTGPKVLSTTITPTLTLLSYTPVAGTYTTTIGSGAGSAVVTVKNGKITKITGGLAAQCRILTLGKSAIVALPFGLKPGDTVITAGTISRTVTVTQGVNFFNANGVLTAQIKTPAKFGPLFNATPAVLSFDLTLGSGAGEHPVAGILTSGDATHPWTTQILNTRTRIVP